MPFIPFAVIFHPLFFSRGQTIGCTCIVSSGLSLLRYFSSGTENVYSLLISHHLLLAVTESITSGISAACNICSLRSLTN